MEYFQFAKSLSLTCGKKMKEAFAVGATDIQEKECMADLVTITDKEIENFSKEEIKSKYPDHQFIGEESLTGGAKCNLTDQPTWILDPIDGTTNFINRFPYFCYSLGFYINKQAVLGIVYNPELDLFFYAIKNNGAFLNDKPIAVSKTEEIKKCVGVTDLGNDRHSEKIKIRVDNMRKFVTQSRGVRSLGSAAMHLCMVAMGSCDVYYEFGLHIWDMAAGKLIVEEAGGVCALCDGSELNLTKRQILACSTRKLMNEVVPIIQAVPYDSD